MGLRPAHPRELRARLTLTRVLGGAGEVVAAGDGGYQLALPPDVDLVVDVEQATVLLADARAALATDPELALVRAGAAWPRAGTVPRRPPRIVGGRGRPASTTWSSAPCWWPVTPRRARGRARSRGCRGGGHR